MNLALPYHLCIEDSLKLWQLPLDSRIIVFFVQNKCHLKLSHLQLKWPIYLWKCAYSGISWREIISIFYLKLKNLNCLYLFVVTYKTIFYSIYNYCASNACNYTILYNYKGINKDKVTESPHPRTLEKNMSPIEKLLLTPLKTW